MLLGAEDRVEPPGRERPAPAARAVGELLVARAATRTRRRRSRTPAPAGAAPGCRARRGSPGTARGRAWRAGAERRPAARRGRRGRRRAAAPAAAGRRRPHAGAGVEARARAGGPRPRRRRGTRYRRRSSGSGRPARRSRRAHDAPAAAPARRRGPRASAAAAGDACTSTVGRRRAADAGGTASATATAERRGRTRRAPGTGLGWRSGPGEAKATGKPAMTAHDLTERERERVAPYVTDTDRPGLRPDGPPRGGEGRALRPLLAQPEVAAAPAARRVPAGLGRRARRGARRRSARRAPRPSTTGCWPSTATTRWPSSAAPTSRSRARRTCSPRCSSGGAWRATSSSRPATSPTPTAPAGAYRYHRPAAVVAHPELGPAYARDARRRLRRLRRAPAAAGRARRRATCRRTPAPRPRRASGRCAPRALDLLRGLLPAATTANVGIFASGQAYEAMLVRMGAHPLPEARECAARMLVELRKVIPAFLTRVDRDDRGVAHGRYLRGLARPRPPASRRASCRPSQARGRTAGALVDFDPDGEARVLAHALWPAERRRAGRVRERGPPSSTRPSATRALAAWAGGRARTGASGPGARSRRRRTPSRSSATTAPTATSSATGC